MARSKIRFCRRAAVARRIMTRYACIFLKIGQRACARSLPMYFFAFGYGGVECQSGLGFCSHVIHRVRRLGVKCACVGVGRRTGAVATACRSVMEQLDMKEQGTVMERSKPVP